MTEAKSGDGANMAADGAPSIAHILTLFCEAAWEIDQRKWDAVGADDKISDLGLDSVAMLEVVGYLEDALKVEISDEDLAEVKTVGDLARAVIRAGGGAG